MRVRTVSRSWALALLPGVSDPGNGKGLVSVEQLTLPSALNLGSVLAAGAFIYSVISLMGTLKIALRAMFGLVNPVMRPVVGQLANLAGFLIIVAGVLVTAVASVVTTTLSGSVGRSLGLPQSLTGTGAWVMTLLLSFLIDTGVLALLITVCGIRPPRRDLLQGCMLGAFALGVLRQVGTGAAGSGDPTTPHWSCPRMPWSHWLTGRCCLRRKWPAGRGTWPTTPPLPVRSSTPCACPWRRVSLCRSSWRL